MFENPSLLKAWKPFLDITEEEEYLLQQIEPISDDSDDDNNSSTYRHAFYSRSQVSYARLTPDGRKSLQKYSGTEFLKDLDNVIFNFVQGTITMPNTSDFFTCSIDWHARLLCLTMKDSFHRLMAHSICTYYNATSLSELNYQNQKVIKVTPPNSFKFTPSEKLYDFLKSSNADNIYWSSIKTEKTKTKKSSTKKSRKRTQAPRNNTPTQFSNEKNVGWF